MKSFDQSLQLKADVFLYNIDIEMQITVFVLFLHIYVFRAQLLGQVAGPLIWILVVTGCLVGCSLVFA